MNKKIMVVICVVMSLLAFLGGIEYGYREYQPRIEQLQVEYDTLQSKYDEFYRMPLDTKTAYKWLDDMVAYHQLHIDMEISTEILPLELHQEYIDLYGKIKDLFLEFDNE